MYPDLWDVCPATFIYCFLQPHHLAKWVWDTTTTFMFIHSHFSGYFSTSFAVARQREWKCWNIIVINIFLSFIHSLLCTRRMMIFVLAMKHWCECNDKYVQQKKCYDENLHKMLVFIDFLKVILWFFILSEISL